MKGWNSVSQGMGAMVRLFGLLWFGLLFGCASVVQPYTPPHYALEDQLLGARYERQVVRAESFDSVFFARTQPDPQRITVLIEGDGYAWKTRHVPSEDPTPRMLSPVAEYALRAPESENIVYLARPCQLTHANEWRNCTSAVWTRERFDENALAHFKTVFEELRGRYPKAQFSVLGYSGGGVMASMLAASMPHEVCFLGTVATPIDTAAWTGFHRITPLNTAYSGELLRQNLQELPQMHLVGSRDLVVPKRVVEPFWKQMDSKHLIFEVVSGATHTKGWSGAMDRLLVQSKASCGEGSPEGILEAP